MCYSTTRMRMKRKRRSDPSWFSLLRDDIRNNGGFVHPDLEFSETDRILSVKQKIHQGEVVLRIPQENFLTQDWAFSMCQPWLVDIITMDCTDVTWKNPRADLAIAIAMASCHSQDECPYLHSLPEPSSYDALPRRWSDKDIWDLLDGTSLLRHVISAKKGVIEDYKHLLERYQKYEKNDEIAPFFPSFEKFSDMLAAVSSRAFQIGTTSKSIACVPILDLGNHTRGKRTNKQGKKNVSYQYEVSEQTMIVTAAIDIDSGESIRLTYGAKANAHLLLNYGFCIPQNLEPDGSSNDTLEFCALSTGSGSNNGVNAESSCRDKSICLRAGPKSYSYGGFVTALDKYYEMQGNEIELNKINVLSSLKNGIEDSFEDFLAQCEEGDGEEFIDLYEEKNSDLESADEDEFQNKGVQANEIDALQRFKSDLIKLSKGYNVMKTKYATTSDSVELGSTDSQRYSTILSISELRTIYFFVLSIDKVLDLLDSKVKQENNSTLGMVPDLEDHEMIDKQTDDLAKSYISIRHGLFN